MYVATKTDMRLIRLLPHVQKRDQEVLTMFTGFLTLYRLKNILGTKKKSIFFIGQKQRISKQDDDCHIF